MGTFWRAERLGEQQVWLANQSSVLQQAEYLPMGFQGLLPGCFQAFRQLLVLFSLAEGFQPLPSGFFF
jgi:hypothetical protein